MSELDQEIAIDNSAPALVAKVSSDSSSKDPHILPVKKSVNQKILGITLLLGFAAFVAIYFLDLSDTQSRVSTPLNRSSEISNKAPVSVRFREATSGNQIADLGAYGARFQVEYTSDFRSVGWVGFVSDQGQTMLDLVSIGSSMATFEKGVAKTFPVLLTKPNVRSGYHMVIILCTDALTLESRPKFQEVEAFMRISSMGGRLPRSDCSAVSFRF
jgi:hypothetical protein